jgi:hypothetical protein
MIISLFMDETPLVCGSGHNPGVRGDGWSHGPMPGDVPHRRDNAHDEHQKAAGDDHVSALSGKMSAEGDLQA